MGSSIGGVTNGQETIQIVQKGFPELAEFDEERITFLNGDDAIIFDEAWEHFVSSPPEKLKIKVADAPGEWDKRKSTQHQVGGSADNFRSKTYTETRLCRMCVYTWRNLPIFGCDCRFYHYSRISEEVGGRRVSGQ